MSRPINADKLKSYYKCIIGQIKGDTRADFKYINDLTIKILERVCKEIDNEKTMDVAPIVHAHWIKQDQTKNEKAFLSMSNLKCSNPKCGKEFHMRVDFCPHCGAKMDEEE